MDLLNGLECILSNLRTSKKDKPMCTLIDYVSIKDRESEKKIEETQNIGELYEELFKKIDIFKENEQNLWKFYEKLKDLNNYHYADSILMAFEGYKYLKNNFDFLLRSDMDVFLTPGFAKWLPENCNDFITGMNSFTLNQIYLIKF